MKIFCTTCILKIFRTAKNQPGSSVLVKIYIIDQSVCFFLRDYDISLISIYFIDSKGQNIFGYD